METTTQSRCPWSKTNRSRKPSAGKARLQNFIRSRVPDPGDAEDILQDVFYELVETYRLMEPIEQMGAWLFRVARNRITDLFRKKKPELWTKTAPGDAERCCLRRLPDLRRSMPEASCSRKLKTRWMSCPKSSARFLWPTK